MPAPPPKRRERMAAALPPLSLLAVVAGMVATVVFRHSLLLLAGVAALLGLLAVYSLIRGPDPRQAASGLPPGSVLFTASSATDAGPRGASSAADGPAAAVGGPVGERRPSEILAVRAIGSGARAVALAYHPRGRMLVVGGEDGRVHTWGTAAPEGPDPEPTWALTHPGGLTAMAFSPDGRWLATAGPTGGVHVWEAAGSGRWGPVATAGHPGRGEGRAVQCVDVGPGGRLVTGARDGSLAVWDPVPGPTGGVRFTLTARRTVAGRWARAGRSRAGVLAVRFAPGGGLLAAGSSANSAAPARLWRSVGPAAALPGKGTRLRPHAVNPWGDRGPTCPALAFHPSAPLLVTASDYDYTVATGYGVGGGHHSAVVIWDLADPDHPEALVTLNEEASVSVTRGSGAPEWVSPLVLVGHAAPVGHLAIDPHGRWLATGDDGAVMLWDLTTPSRPVHRETLVVDGRVRALAFAPDRPHLACLAGDRVLLWDLPLDQPRDQA